MTENLKQFNCKDCSFNSNCSLYMGIVGIIPSEVYQEFFEKEIGRRCNEFQNNESTNSEVT